MPARKRTARPVMPPELAAVPGFADLWNSRVDALPANRRPTPLGEEIQLREALALLKSHGPAVLKDAVEQAINCGWTGFKVEWLKLPPPKASKAGGAAYRRLDVSKL